MVAATGLLEAKSIVSAGTALLTQEDLVDRIRLYNPSATAQFLARFDRCELEMYLQHLIATSVPRGRGARWERPNETPAITFRIADDDA
ncbi:MAG: hypothetical protein H6812_08985 [Phycisphaeraceae bacterium]|nr:hypothetical protein [Phycisphaerales bacterium]MCB9843376.1 hypothetical protein [Phycisphaeraceae bacterium]